MFLHAYLYSNPSGFSPFLGLSPCSWFHSGSRRGWLILGYTNSRIVWSRWSLGFWIWMRRGRTCYVSVSSVTDVVMLVSCTNCQRLWEDQRDRVKDCFVFEKQVQSWSESNMKKHITHGGTWTLHAHCIATVYLTHCDNSISGNRSNIYTWYSYNTQSYAQSYTNLECSLAVVPEVIL